VLAWDCVYYRFYDTPWGPGLTAYCDDALLRVVLPAWLEKERLLSFLKQDSFCRDKKLFFNADRGEVEEFLEAYFANRPLNFVPVFNLYLERFTPFVRSVLWELQTIPWGEVITYQELAQRIGKPRAQRAVGLALGKNPFPILLPCHRVVGKKGLGGFSSYGLRWKILLLSLEISRNDCFPER
jgi:methylated-DNA-[protein]-cysteine S-methyltransferase